MWLTAPNTYQEVTYVEEGSLVAFDADALGFSGLGTVVTEGGSDARKNSAAPRTCAGV